MHTSRPFKVSGKDIFHTLLFTPGTGWLLWTLLAAGILTVTLGIILDLRLLVIGLMICLTIIPTAGLFIYFHKVLAPDMVGNILPHTIERLSDGYIVRIFRKEEQDCDDDEMDENESLAECGQYHIPDSSITDIKEYDMYRILFLSSAPMSILYVPKSCHDGKATDA